ncbi:MAG TPA: hypothetical protein VMR34_03465, partial [Candidatus Saccharimonadales bacterium]|nr:hypothetical protein [Candidatus Saccharimonadales bacterium]
IGNGVTKTIYIKGNLIISSNITYASNWTTPSDIPSLTFVVAGNIYINPSVTQLYGNYFSTGTVYTCTDSTTGAGIYATGAACGMGNSGSSTQLQFYGSLMAKQIAFERTYGAVNTNGPVANSPAEVYNYSPAEWLGGYGTGNLGNNYGSITNLPPLL